MDALNQFLEKKRGPYLKYKERIEVMMSSGNYEWAAETLLGIFDHIEEHGSISEKQIEAVDNIEKSIHERSW